MENTKKKTAEVVVVGTGRKDVRVSLIVNSETETVVCTMIAVRSKNNGKAKDALEATENHEMLCLRHLGYNQVGNSVQSKKKIGKRFFIETKYVFQWTKWKWGVMGMKKPK